MEYLIIWFKFLREVLKGIAQVVSAYIFKRTIKATLRRRKQKGGFRIVTLHSIYGEGGDITMETSLKFIMT